MVVIPQNEWTTSPLCTEHGICKEHILVRRATRRDRDEWVNSPVDEEKRSKDDDGVFRDVVYYVKKGLRWMEGDSIQ